MKLLIVRHGETDWNKEKRMQGLKDIPLNDNGIMQARKLSKCLDLSEIDICISSPLKRAKKTASIIINGKVSIIYDDLLKERTFGTYEGSPVNYDLISRMWDYQLNTNEGNLESLKDCLARAKKFLDKIKEKYPNKVVLIVSHGSFMKSLHYTILGYNENTNFLDFKPENAKVYVYNI